MKTSQWIFSLRINALLEAISYLILLGYAMPMKYIYANPIPVKIAGMVHGVLFIPFCFLLLICFIKAKWSLFEAAKIFIASLIPLAPFFIDSDLKREQKKHRDRENKSL